MNRFVIGAMAVLALAGCPSKGNDTGAAPSAQTAPSSAPLAASGAPSTSGSAATPPPTTAGKAAWSGSYSLAVGTLSLPTENKDYAGVKQFKDDPSKYMGDGKIELTVEADKVAGTLEGAAGPAIIDGSIIDGEIRGIVRRKDPKDDGLTGSVTAKIAGSDAEGKLHLADGTTAIIREAKISLKKK